MTYTSKAKRNLLATSANEPVLYLLEITDPDLSEPVRVVNNRGDIVSRGQIFLEMDFDFVIQDDQEGSIPRAKLEFSNVGRELTQWLEYSRGGVNAKCRVMLILPSEPDVYIKDITFDMAGMVIDYQKVSSSLSFENTYGMPAVPYSYTPATSPGGF